ncbi:MAG TPA: SDR family oxidoreductase [Candidatus Thermoplasmatota archaeon]|nr:SDR family oxidoreductase [Candidatus Thermoplasmatota archaeon]
MKPVGSVSKLKGKNVLITGSSSGIGRATALAFSTKGAVVAITYSTHKKDGEEVLRECQRNSEAALFHLDVRRISSMEQVVRDVVTRFGRIDVLVNNAGVLCQRPLHEQSMDDIEKQVRVNLLGVIRMTRVALPELLKQRDGIILNIASGAGKQGFAELSVYCATKFGVRGFTQALAQELPSGLRTYCINPGTTATPMTGFTGMDPRKVADVIVRAAEETLGTRSGGDVDVWEYVR